MPAKAAPTKPKPTVVKALGPKSKTDNGILPPGKTQRSTDVYNPQNVDNFDPTSVVSGPVKYKPSAAVAKTQNILAQILAGARGIANRNGPSPIDAGAFDPGVGPDFSRIALPDQYGLKGAMIDPEALAKSGANAEYDNMIAALQRRLTGLGPQNAQNLQDIGDWYGQVAGTNEKGAATEKAALAQNLNELGGGAQGLINALGGEANSASGDIGGAATLASGGLRALGSVDQSFASDLASVLGLQKSQALTDEQRRGQATVADLAAQIAGAQQEKGQRYNELLQQAKQQAFDQQNQMFGNNMSVAQMRQQMAQQGYENQASRQGFLANLASTRYGEQQQSQSDKWQRLLGLQNMALGNALAPGQIQAQDLANIAARYNIGSTAQGLQTQPFKDAATIKQIGANITATLASKNKNGWDFTQPSSVQALNQGINGVIAGPQGGLKMDPESAWNGVLIGLGQMGLSGNPKALSVAMSAFKQALNTSHSKHQYTNYTISNSGQLVKGTKPQLKK